MHKVIKHQSTIVGRLYRDVSRNMNALSQRVQESLGYSVAKAARLIVQTRSHTNKVKAKDKQPKLYNWHAPEVEFISKGKSRSPYEFGMKVGIGTALKGTLLVWARAFPSNPYDGNSLNEQVEQANILLQGTELTPETVYVDLGYRGVDKDKLGIDTKHRGKFKSLSNEEKKSLKRS